MRQSDRQMPGPAAHDRTYQEKTRQHAGFRRTARGRLRRVKRGHPGCAVENSGQDRRLDRRPAAHAGRGDLLRARWHGFEQRGRPAAGCGRQGALHRGRPRGIQAGRWEERPQIISCPEKEEDKKTQLFYCASSQLIIYCKDCIMEREINGKMVETDPEGYLVNLEDWSEELAVELAKEDKLELGET